MKLKDLKTLITFMTSKTLVADSKKNQTTTFNFSQIPSRYFWIIPLFVLEISLVGASNARADSVSQGVGESASKASSQLPSTPGSDIESGGNSAALATTMGVGANAAVSVFMFKTCAKNPAVNQWACVMGTMSAAQAVMMAASSKNASKSQQAATCRGSGCLGSGGASGSTGSEKNIVVEDMQSDSYGDAPAYQESEFDKKLNSLNTKSQNQAQAVFDEFKKLGYTYDASAGAVVTPKGKVSVAALKGGSGILNASDKKEIDGLNSDASKIVNDYKSKIQSEIDAMVAYESPSNSGNSRHSEADSLFDKSNLRMPASQSGSLAIGLSRKFGQDSIGVAGDNIFKMISRRYDSQRQGGKFLLTP